MNFLNTNELGTGVLEELKIKTDNINTHFLVNNHILHAVTKHV